MNTILTTARCPVCGLELPETNALRCVRPGCGVELEPLDDARLAVRTFRLHDHFSLCVLPFCPIWASKLRLSAINVLNMGGTRGWGCGRLQRYLDSVGTDDVDHDDTADGVRVGGTFMRDGVSMPVTEPELVLEAGFLLLAHVLAPMDHGGAFPWLSARARRPPPHRAPPRRQRGATRALPASARRSPRPRARDAPLDAPTRWLSGRRPSGAADDGTQPSRRCSL